MSLRVVAPQLGRTPLHIACAFGKLELISELHAAAKEDHAMDVNCADNV